MKQLLPNISNSQLCGFTMMLSSLLQAKHQAGKEPTFSFAELIDHVLKDHQAASAIDPRITDSNREATIAQNEASALAYSDARNRGAQPKSLIGLDHKLVASVKSWSKRKGSYLRGKKRRENDIQ